MVPSESMVMDGPSENSASMPVSDLARQQGVSEKNAWCWDSSYGSREIPQLRRLRMVMVENARQKKLQAKTALDSRAKAVVKVVLQYGSAT